ncbi:MAG: hypothetical protein ABJN52_04170 [Litorimonas sp.]
MNLTFWKLFDHFWDQGIGNFLHQDGTPTSWTALTLETAFDGTPDKRSIEYWQSQTNMPSPDNIRKLSIVASGGDHALRKQWYDALIKARRETKRNEKEVRVEKPQQQAPIRHAEMSQSGRKKRFGLIAVMAFIIATIAVIWSLSRLHDLSSSQTITNIRVCDATYFNKGTKKCSKHVAVFVHGIDEVFLSFDFENVPENAPFERWWIRNGERVAGRPSFNDAAWPGYTYWRPGVLLVGQYVVRVVVDEKVFTQSFTVQPDGFDAVTIEE